MNTTDFMPLVWRRGIVPSATDSRVEPISREATIRDSVGLQDDRLRRRVCEAFSTWPWSRYEPPSDATRVLGNVARSGSSVLPNAAMTGLANDVTVGMETTAKTSLGLSKETGGELSPDHETPKTTTVAMAFPAHRHLHH